MGERSYFSDFLGLLIADQFLVYGSLQAGIAHPALIRFLPMPFWLSFSLAAFGLLVAIRWAKRYPLGLALAGAGFSSNVLTYLTRGTVYDYIPLPGGVYTNAADLLIVAGCGVVGWSVVRATFRRPV